MSNDPLVSGGGLPDELPPEPFGLLRAWYDQAVRVRAVPNPDAMTLATCDAAGRPAARIVLCRGLDAAAGELVFYTNYESRKARDLAENSFAAAVFHWDHAAQQARVAGAVRPASGEESDAYFARRPLISRVGAWASQQSRPLADRGELLARFGEVMQRFDVSLAQLAANDASCHVPRPPHWGGYRLRAESVELWLGGDGRLHDRALWTRKLDDPASAWVATRLYP